MFLFELSARSFTPPCPRGACIFAKFGKSVTVLPLRLKCFTGPKVELQTQRCMNWPFGLPNCRIHNLDLLLRRSIVEDPPSREHVSAQAVALFASCESFRGVPVRKEATGG